MQKTCKRCGCTFEAGEHTRRVYCEACRKASKREHEQTCQLLLEGNRNYRRAQRMVSAALARRSRAFESRLLTREEIAALDADCDAALAQLRAARKAAWARLGKRPWDRVSSILANGVKQ